MTRRLADVIEALGGLAPRPTARELADALWLARSLPPAEATGEPAPGVFTDGRHGEPPPPPEPSDQPPEHAPPGEPPRRTAPAPQARLHVAPRHAASGGVVRTPALPAIPRALDLARALRPLRGKAESRTVEHLREEATAQWIADTGIWEPIMEPAPERCFDLALVADDSASMVIWARLIDEFHTLLERLGAFRDVRLWRLDTGSPDAGDDLVLRARGASAGRSPNELIDPTRRRVVLVFSDCIGPAWSDGRAAELLERWAATGPVAIVQPLPQRLWWRCGTLVEAVRLGAAEPGTPNRRLTVSSRDGFTTPPGTPIPVLEAAPRWLRPWAELVGGGARRIDAMAVFTRAPAPKVSEEEDDRAEPPTPRQRVLAFRAGASPDAYRLACHFAAAPLRLKVMSLVQQAVLPESTRMHLAEVFLGGLMRRADPADADAAPDDVLYEFHDGVRELLLGGLERGEALLVLRKVWELVRERLGSPLDFAALLRKLEDGTENLQDELPFAQVAAHVLRRLGGRYAQLAEHLPVPEGSSAESPDEPGSQGHGAAAGGPRLPAPRAGEPSAPDARVVGGGLPTRNPDFTGRDALLRVLRERLPRHVTTLLPAPAHELGGQGKSQLAVEFAHRYAGDYDLIWWVPAEQVTLARSSVAELARVLGTPLSDDINRTVEHVLEALREGRTFRRWLLIYDNAADPRELLPLLPVLPDEPLRPAGPAGHTLVTSRDRRWAELTETVEVGLFERRESVALLRRRAAALSAAEADGLAERVGDLPLAVEQVGAWHAATGRPSAEFMRLFDERLGESAGTGPPPGRPADLAITLDISFEGLRADAPRAGELLELLAFFGAEPVAADLLTAGASARLPETLRATLADPHALLEAMTAITRYSLGRLYVGDGPPRVQVHRLVRTLLQDRMPEDGRAATQNLVHRVLAAATPATGPDDESTWELRRRIAPHVVPAGVIHGATAEIREIALDQMRYLYLLGDFEGSRVLGELALRHWRAAQGEDDGSVLHAGRELGNVLRALGNVTAAADLNIDLYRRTLGRYGPDHQETLRIAQSRAADLRLRGDFVGALDLDQDTLQRMVRMFGRDRPDTFRAINNVGIDLRLLGEFQQAHDIDADALERLRSRFGPAHRSTLLAMNQFARDLHGLGRYWDAARTQQEALEQMQRTLSPDHAFVLHAEMSQAATLRALGSYGESLRLAEDTHRLHLQRFGERHQDTLAARRVLALACVRTGDADRARGLVESALTGYRSVLGRDHPFAHACTADLTVTLRALGGHEPAQAIDGSTLRALVRLLGPDHYYSLCCSVGLVHDLYNRGRLETARIQSAETLARFRARYGGAHPYTLACTHNHQVISAALGVDGPAGNPLQVLARVLGDDHPEIRTAREGGLLECVIEPIPL